MQGYIIEDINIADGELLFLDSKRESHTLLEIRQLIERDNQRSMYLAYYNEEDNWKLIDNFNKEILNNILKSNRVKEAIKYTKEKHDFVFSIINNKDDIEVKIAVSKYMIKNENIVRIPDFVEIIKPKAFNIIEKDTIKIIAKNIKLAECIFKENNTKVIDLSEFAFNKLKSMEQMFILCKNLRKIEFGDISTENLDNIRDLVCGCVNLEELDLRKFNLDNIEKKQYDNIYK